MDVTSPAAADPVSRPSPPLTTPAEPSRVAVALRRAGIAVAGVGVAALTAAACVLSFEDLRVLAVAGRAPAGLAYLYPAAFDALLVVAMIGVLLLRGGWWPIRLQAGVVLTLLFTGAVAAEVATAMRMAVDEQRTAVVVAVAPWVMLVLALWLWLLLIKHAAARRAATDAALAGLPPSGRDIVPFPEAGRSASERPPAAGEHRYGQPSPVRPDRSGQPVHPGYGDHYGHPGQLVHHPAAEIMLDPHAAPPLETAPHHDLPVGEPVVGPTAAPETPEVDDVPPPREPVAHRPGKPMRWGDLVRPRQGDLLVHPPRPAVRASEEAPETGSASRLSERVETWDTDSGIPREPEPAAAEATATRGATEAAGTGGRPAAETRPEKAEAEVSERDADTQPLRAVKGRPARSRAADVTPGGTTEETAAEPPAETPAEPPTETPAVTAPRKRAPSRKKAVAPPEPVPGAETADAGEAAEAPSYETDSAAPPSGRMRSTPVPPGEK